MSPQIVFIQLFPRTSKYLCVSGKVNTSIKVVLRSSVNSRLFSSNDSKKCYRNVVHNHPNCLNFSSFHRYVNQRNDIFQGHSNLLRQSFTIQKRNFSVGEAFDSAIVTHSAIFRAISESAVVEQAQKFVVQFHDSTGLPWWLSIILTTIFMRTVLTLPVAIYQNYVMARLENLKPEMDEIVNNIKYELNREVRRNKWPERKARGVFNTNVKKEWTRLIQRDNCHPAKVAILALVQIPLWVVFSTAFRNLVYRLPYNDTVAQFKFLELSVGGVAWFPDLTVSDSFVLPIVLGLTNLAIVEVQASIHKTQRSKLQRYATNFFRTFSVCMIPVAASVPSCITLYWTTSSMFGLCQNLSLLSPRVRKLFGIPVSPSAHTHPYSHLANQIRNKFRN